MKIVVETPRLILREIMPDDAEGMFELDSDPEVHRYLGNKPVATIEQSKIIIDNIRKQYLDYGIGRWAVMDKNTQAFMGWSGLKFVTDRTNGHQNFYDVGYRILRRYWGQGIATESAIASLAYAFNNLDLQEVFASASIDNAASNRILQKLGLRFIETYKYQQQIPCNWYSIKKADYKPIHYIHFPKM